MSKTLEVKKLVLVLVTSTLITGPRKKDLECVPYIHYLVQFKKDTMEVRVLINSRSKVNAMASTYAKKLDLRMRKTNIKA